jgi:hypothetical protein
LAFHPPWVDVCQHYNLSSPNTQEGDYQTLKVLKKEVIVEDEKTTAYELGGTVLLGLGVLTAAEFAFGVRASSIVLLFIIAMIKGGMILNYFMHVTRLWSEEEGH